MVLGIDTGFLLLVGEQQPRCLELWSEINQGEHLLIISTLCLAEYTAFQIQRSKLDTAEQFIQVLETLESVSIVPVSKGIATQSARYRVGMRLPTVDSIIFSTALFEKCNLFLTTDSVFDQDSIRDLISVEILS